MQSIIQLTTYMFYQYPQSLLLSAQQYWISFNAANHGRKLELLFFNKWLTDDCVSFLVETLETYLHYD